MKLNDKIYTCRTRAKLSQEELTERVGVSRQAVSRWECGDNIPEPAKLLMLARLFGVTTDWLLDDNCEMPEESPKEENKQPWVDTLVENCKSLAHRFDSLINESIPSTEETQAASSAPAPESEPKSAPEPESAISEAESGSTKSPRRSMKDTFKRLIARFGWQLGVYIAAIGILITALSGPAQQIIAAIGIILLFSGVTLALILFVKMQEKKKG